MSPWARRLAFQASPPLPPHASVVNHLPSHATPPRRLHTTVAILGLHTPAAHLLPEPYHTAAGKPTGYTVTHQLVRQVRQVRQVRHKRHSPALLHTAVAIKQACPPAVHLRPRHTTQRHSKPTGYTMAPPYPSQKFPKIPKISHAGASPPRPANHRCHTGYPCGTFLARAIPRLRNMQTAAAIKTKKILQIKVEKKFIAEYLIPEKFFNFNKNRG